LDGLDIAYIEFLENGGKWTGEIVHSECVPYSVEWIEKLKLATSLSALDYQLLHTEYGHYIGNAVNAFIKKYQLHFKVALVASHGHTTFHIPSKKMTAQLGEGGAIAAVIQLPVVTDLRALDVGFGGEGAPIVPIGEKLLLNDYSYFLNLGGIANVSVNADRYLAFDVCAANRVLNMLANEVGLDFDNEGVLARSGQLNQQLLNELNSLAYYSRPVPKSLPNSFGTDEVFPI
ncbi:MAG TPA: anhydro-N-acetylmuramic acid kinase, partial [Niabella sp.]|nr:anhydro-N-acetylmuramic acid kinase [Niabella sp.]